MARGFCTVLQCSFLMLSFQLMSDVCLGFCNMKISHQLDCSNSNSCAFCPCFKILSIIQNLQTGTLTPQSGFAPADKATGIKYYNQYCKNCKYCFRNVEINLGTIWGIYCPAVPCQESDQYQ